MNRRIAAVVVGLLLAVYFLTLKSMPHTDMTYSQLRDQIAKQGSADSKEAIVRVIFANDDDCVEVQTGDVVEKVPIPKEDRQSLIEDLKKAHVAIDAKEPDRAGYWFKLISSFFLPILLLVGFMFMFRSAKKSNTNYSFAPSQDIAKLQNEVSELKTQVSEIKSSLDALSDRLSSNNP